MDIKNLTVYEKPKLVKPYLVMGFEGWPDAGRVSSGVVSYLRDELGTSKLAEVRPDDFYLFQSPGGEAKRPVISIEDGLVTALNLPTTTFWFYKGEKSAHDLIVSLGREPELRWNDYVNLVLDLVREFGVIRIYTVGGTYDVVPHTMEPIIAAVLSMPDLASEVRKYDIQPINYGGPSSIHTALLTSASKKKIEAISLWGYVPHYVQVPNTKVCCKILSRLSGMLELVLDLENIRKDSEQLDEMVDKAVAQKPELLEYVKRLELEYGKSKDGVAEPLKEDIIKEIEDFLKRREGGSH
jgi:proteasome assembly chaperone (PAC2) family protein